MCQVIDETWGQCGFVMQVWQENNSWYDYCSLYGRWGLTYIRNENKCVPVLYWRWFQIHCWYRMLYVTPIDIMILVALCWQYIGVGFEIGDYLYIYIYRYIYISIWADFVINICVANVSSCFPILYIYVWAILIHTFLEQELQEWYFLWIKKKQNI